MTDVDGSTGRIAILNRMNDSVEEIILSSKGIWYAPFFWKGYAYLLPMSDEAACYRVNTETKTAEVFSRLDELFLDRAETEKGTRRRNSNVQAYEQNGSIVTFIRRPDLTWFTYDFETDELISVVYEIRDEDYLTKLRKEYYDRIFDDVCKENLVLDEEQMPVSEFLNRI